MAHRKQKHAKLKVPLAKPQTNKKVSSSTILVDQEKFKPKSTKQEKKQDETETSFIRTLLKRLKPPKVTI